MAGKSGRTGTPGNVEGKMAPIKIAMRDPMKVPNINKSRQSSPNGGSSQPQKGQGRSAPVSIQVPVP